MQISKDIITNTDKKTKAIRKKSDFKRSLPLLMLAIPGLVYLIINNYLPMLGITLAFKTQDFSKGAFGGDWVGFENFNFLFKTKDAWIMTRNTILYNLAFIVLGTICAIIIAILIHEIIKSKFAKVLHNALILPNLISMVVVSYIVYAFLNPDSGLINNSILNKIGMDGIAWYSEAKYWPFILVFVFIWKCAGFQSILYTASIAGIDSSIYEAAQIDGATKLQQIIAITLPLLKPTIILTTLMAIGRIMSSDFGLFYQVPMNAGALYETTQTIDTFVYRAMMQLNDVGMASAAGLYQSVVGFILVLSANGIVRKISSEDALF